MISCIEGELCKTVIASSTLVMSVTALVDLPSVPVVVFVIDLTVETGFNNVSIAHEEHFYIEMRRYGCL